MNAHAGMFALAEIIVVVCTCVQACRGKALAALCLAIAAWFLEKTYKSQQP